MHPDFQLYWGSVTYNTKAYYHQGVTYNYFYYGPSSGFSHSYLAISSSGEEDTYTDTNPWRLYFGLSDDYYTPNDGTDYYTDNLYGHFSLKNLSATDTYDYSFTATIHGVNPNGS